MIHFFPRFSKSAENSPFGQSLQALGIPHRIIATHVPQNYTYRLQLLLLGYPILAWSALSSATRSMFGWRRGQNQMPPGVAIISSDVEVLIFAFVRALPFAARPRLMFMPFIFTQRVSPFLNRMRLSYYRFVMRRVSCAICHSTLETERYRRLFAGCNTDFVFVPWGGHVPTPAEVLARAVPLPPKDGLPRVVAAGRSGRDYPTLVAAVVALPCRLTIVCNEHMALGGVVASEQVEVLTNTFYADYFMQLLQADIVVVPLQVEDISAGQMVVIQAMAMARPLVVTHTPTIGDYLHDNDTALLVPRGDVSALAAAIRQLLEDPAAAAAMGRRAQARYAAQFSTDAHLRALVKAVSDPPMDLL